MQMGRFHFRHRWNLTVTLLILVPLGLTLGFWQMQRAADKQAQIDMRQQHSAPQAELLQSDDSQMAEMLYRQVEVRGRFDLQRQILLENQKYNGRPGYHVFTPLRIQGSDVYVMVNRGWIKQGDDRRFIPDLPGDESLVNIQGRVESVPSVGMKLGEPGESGMVWPKRLIYVDLPWLSKETGYNLMPYIVYQTSGQEYGLIRDWRQQFQSGPRMTPEKHMGYAVQWFSLVILSLIMYVVLSLRKTSSKTGSGDDQGE